MEQSQNLIVTHAKHNHKVGSQISPAEITEHTDPRFYTWSADLVNSINAEKVKVMVNKIEGDVSAGEKYATDVELGTPNRRAFPFLKPALNASYAGIIAIMGAAVKKVIK